MAATGPYFWTQTLKFLSPDGTARARWHRLDLADNLPFSSWDAGDGDGPQAWRFQEFNCPGLDSGVAAASVTITCAHSPATLALVLQAVAGQWLIQVTQYRIVLGGLIRVDSVLLGSVTVSGTLTGFSIGATSSPPPVAVSVPSLLLTQQNIGTPCRLDFQ
jgi:hypothetical protein